MDGSRTEKNLEWIGKIEDRSSGRVEREMEKRKESWKGVLLVLERGKGNYGMVGVVKGKLGGRQRRAEGGRRKVGGKYRVVEVWRESCGGGRGKGRGRKRKKVW